jgi:hypothetical protein
MHNLRSGHAHSAIVHDYPATRNLMGSYQWPETRAVLIELPYADIVSFVAKVVSDHLPHLWRAPAVDRRDQARQPRELEQRTKINVMVRVVMRDEYVPEVI